MAIPAAVYVFVGYIVVGEQRLSGIASIAIGVQRIRDVGL